MGNATSNSTTLSGVVYGTFENGWEVRAVFTNAPGSATTNPATLTVLHAGRAGDHHPADRPDGHPGQMSPSPRGQRDPDSDGAVAGLERRGNHLVRHLGKSHVEFDQLSGVIYGTFENGWQVRAVFTNGAGSATTNPATLTVP